MEELSYQQRVILAALELTKECSYIKGYEFYMAGNDLVITPWINIEDRGRVYSEFLRVTNDKILGRDETIVSELEEKLKTLVE